jgi:hypothetical protein
VLNASAGSLGINQRAHHSIDQFAASTAVPYSTIRPAIFSASLLAAAPEVRASRTWTGLAGTGRIPAGTAELLITREWAILAGENDYTTGTFQQITGRPPRPVAEFLHQFRADFT